MAASWLSAGARPVKLIACLLTVAPIVIECYEFTTGGSHFDLRINECSGDMQRWSQRANQESPVGGAGTQNKPTD